MQVVTLRMVDVEILGAKTAVTEMERPKNITVVLEKILFEVNLYLARYMRRAAAVLHISQLPLNVLHGGGGSIKLGSGEH